MPELTSTLTIVDKSSSVLDAIAKAAEKTSTQIDLLISKMESIGGGFDSAMKDSEKFSKQVEKITDSFNVFGNSVEKNFISVERSVDSISDGLGNVVEQLGQANQKAEKSGSIFDKMKGIFGMGASVAGWISTAAGAIDQFQSAMSAVDKNTNLISRLGQVARSEGIAMEDSKKWKARAEEIRKMLSKQAIGLGVDTSEYTANAITFASNPAFKGIKEAARFSELMSKQFFTSGVGGQAQMSVINQLTQGLAKGKLQGEDLMSILSNAPDVGALLEKAYARLNNLDVDKVSGTVRQLASDGKLTADVIKNAFFGAADEIEKNFEEMPNTFEDMITKFKNQAFEILQPVMQALSEIGNSDEFKSVLNSLGRIIKSLIDVASHFSWVVDIVVSFIDNLTYAVANILDLSFLSLKGRNKKTGDNVDHVAAAQRNKMLSVMNRQTDLLKINIDSINALADIQKKYAERQAELFSFSKEFDRQAEEYLTNYQKNKVDVAVDEWFKANNVKDKDILTTGLLQDMYSKQIEQGGIFNREQYKESTETLKMADAEISKLKELLEKSNDEIANINNNLENVGLSFQQRFDAENLRLKMMSNLPMVESGLKHLQKGRDAIANNINLYDERMREFLKSTAENTAETAKNTRSVSIDRDSILFMKSMTTAEVINRYNNIHDSIAINNHYGSMPSKQRAERNLQAQLQGAQNALRGGA